MENQHPITYEHLAMALTCVLTLFILGSASLYWKGLVFGHDTDTQVRAVVCYNADGTGPTSKCPAVIKCSSKAKTNAEAYEIPCPIWPSHY